MSGKTVKSKASVFHIDTTILASESVVDPADFEKFLTENIKVNNKRNNLGDAITISREKPNVITVRSKNGDLAKRYLKYLTKKYLKKHNLRDYVRVVANTKASYELRYFKVADEEEEEEEEGDE